MQCCGASQRFHRDYGEVTTEIDSGFEGKHTDNPKDVHYNEFTIKPCKKNECGEVHAIASEAEKHAAEEAENERKEQWKEDQREKWTKRRQTLIENNATESQLRRLNQTEKALRNYIEPTEDMISSIDDEFDEFDDILCCLCPLM